MTFILLLSSILPNSCSRKENGHAKRPGEPVCINPHHYNVVNKDRVLSLMLHEVRGLHNTVPGLAALTKMATESSSLEIGNSFFTLLDQFRLAGSLHHPFPLTHQLSDSP